MSAIPLQQKGLWESTKFVVFTFSCMYAFLRMMYSWGGACGGQRSTLAVFLSVYLTVTGSLSEPGAYWLARRAAQWSLGSPLSLPLSAGITSMPLAWLSCTAEGGSELRSSGLHSKYCTPWTIFPAQWCFPIMFANTPKLTLQDSLHFSQLGAAVDGNVSLYFLKDFERP